MDTVRSKGMYIRTPLGPMMVDGGPKTEDLRTPTAPFHYFVFGSTPHEKQTRNTRHFKLRSFHHYYHLLASGFWLRSYMQMLNQFVATQSGIQRKAATWLYQHAMSSRISPFLGCNPLQVYVQCALNFWEDSTKVIVEKAWSAFMMNIWKDDLQNNRLNHAIKPKFLIGAELLAKITLVRLRSC